MEARINNRQIAPITGKSYLREEKNNFPRTYKQDTMGKLIIKARTNILSDIRVSLSNNRHKMQKRLR